MPIGGFRPSDKGGEGGGGHLDPEIRGARSQKKFLSALRASVWSKNKGGGVGFGRLCSKKKHFAFSSAHIF